MYKTFYSSSLDDPCLTLTSILHRVWEQLAKETHPSIFIANVDCGSDNDICRSSQITSYPTFRYFIDGAEYEYQDARSLEALREFIETTLTVQCNPIVDATTCSEKARKYGDKWISKDQSKLKSEIDRLDAMMTNSGSTTAELRSWMRERRGILTIIHQHKTQVEKTVAIDEL